MKQLVTRKNIDVETYKSKKKHLQQRFNIWILQHLQALVFSLGQYIRYPVNNLLSTAVVGISLALPTSFYLLVDNAQHVSSSWDSSLQITLFLKPDIDNEKAEVFAETLRGKKSVEQLRLIPREAAFAEYKQLSGFSPALEILNENPLPNVILITPEKNASSAVIEKLVNELQYLSSVDSVQYENEWLKRLTFLLNIINRVIIILSTLLAIGVLLIIANTIRLSIYNRRSEIEITKLFGGTDRFIQRPFLYSGLWHGVFGGIIAWILTAIAIAILHPPVQQLAQLYASNFKLIGLGFVNGILLVGIGIFLGLFGSWIAVKRHLKAINLS